MEAIKRQLGLKGKIRPRHEPWPPRNKSTRRKMAEFEYPVVSTESAEGGYVVTFPDIPEAITQGEDGAGSGARAQDALHTALEVYNDEGQDLPKASRAKRGQRVVRWAALFGMKLAIYQAMREEKVLKTELAKRASTRI